MPHRSSYAYEGRTFTPDDDMYNTGNTGREVYEESYRRAPGYYRRPRPGGGSNWASNFWMVLGVIVILLLIWWWIRSSRTHQGGEWTKSQMYNQDYGYLNNTTGVISGYHPQYPVVITDYGKGSMTSGIVPTIVRKNASELKGHPCSTPFGPLKSNKYNSYKN